MANESGIELGTAQPQLLFIIIVWWLHIINKRFLSADVHLKMWTEGLVTGLGFELLVGLNFLRLLPCIAGCLM